MTMLSLALFSTMALASKWTDSVVTFGELSIESSLPKGGGSYVDATGTRFSYVVFWVRVVNASKRPTTLDLSFPAAPATVFPSRESYLRLFIPQQPMTAENIDQYDYGFTELKPSLDAHFTEASRLRSVVAPKGEAMFRVLVLFHEGRGSARAALVVKGNDLFFRISVKPDVEGALIPCGHVSFGT